jgi:hypothetical protein
VWDFVSYVRNTTYDFGHKGQNSRHTYCLAESYVRNTTYYFGHKGPRIADTLFTVLLLTQTIDGQYYYFLLTPTYVPVRCFPPFRGRGKLDTVRRYFSIYSSIIHKRSQEAHGTSMETTLAAIPDGKSRTIQRGTETGAWLSVLPSTVSGTELSAQEFRDALSMRYGEAPPDLPACCDGCDAPFKPSRVKESAKDTPTKDTSPEKQEQRATGEDERGDILIRGFWARGTDCILDVRVTGTDTKTYCKRDPAKVLESQEKEKKRKYLEACLKRRRRHFTPFVCSVDGMLGREAKTFAKQLAAKLANKSEKWYSQVCG